MSAISPDAADGARLPSYREQAPEVAERFRKLKERPVILEVRDLVKDFAVRDGGTTRALDRISFRAQFGYSFAVHVDLARSNQIFCVTPRSHAGRGNQFL